MPVSSAKLFEEKPMSKNAKYTLTLLSCAIFVALFGYFILENSAKNERIRAAQTSYEIKSAAREKLAGSFANCAAISLTPHYLTEFIIHELMPLGIGWQLAERGAKSKPKSIEKIGEMFSSPEYYASERLTNHFRNTLDYGLISSHEMKIGNKNISDINNHMNGNASNLDQTKFDIYPSLFVYKSLSSKFFENVSPEDIEIGKKEIDWKMFIVLAKRCKATPYDLHEMSRAPSDPPVRLTMQDTASTITETMDYGAYDNGSEYSMMKRLFWKNLSETAPYKEALADIRTRNASIISEIIKVNESQEKQKAIQKKIANDVIFKGP